MFYVGLWSALSLRLKNNPQQQCESSPILQENRCLIPATSLRDTTVVKSQYFCLDFFAYKSYSYILAKNGDFCENRFAKALYYKLSKILFSTKILEIMQMWKLRLTGTVAHDSQMHIKFTHADSLFQKTHSWAAHMNTVLCCT